MTQNSYLPIKELKTLIKLELNQDNLVSLKTAKKNILEKLNQPNLSNNSYFNELFQKLFENEVDSLFLVVLSRKNHIVDYTQTTHFSAYNSCYKYCTIL